MACSTNKNPSSESTLTLHNPLEHRMALSTNRGADPGTLPESALCLPCILCPMASISVCHVFCIQRHPFLEGALNCFRSPVYGWATLSIDCQTNLFCKPVYRTGSSRASSISLVHSSGKVMPAARAGIGKKRRSRHTGNGVRLQRPAITVVFQDEVSARGAAARERFVSVFRLALHNLRHIVGDARRADMLRAAHGILRLKVVEIALGNDFDNGHSLRLMVPRTATVNSRPLI